MNASDQALTVYLEAEERFKAGKETTEDEVVLALWDETKEQAKMIREQALKISYLEMNQKEPCANTMSAAQKTYAAMIQRISVPPQATTMQQG